MITQQSRTAGTRRGLIRTKHSPLQTRDREREVILENSNGGGQWDGYPASNNWTADPQGVNSGKGEIIAQTRS